MPTPLENILTNSYKEGMITFLNSHPEHFEEAVNLAASNKQPYSWRAAWLLWSCLEENDPRLRKHVDKLLNSIKEKKDGHQRELIKILTLMELNEDQEGFLFDICMNLWEKIGKTPSVRYIAIQFIIRMVKKYPELASELQFITQDHYMETLSPGVKRSVSRMIKE